MKVFDIICLRRMFRGGPSCLLSFLYRNYISVKIMKTPPLKIVTYSGMGVFTFLVCHISCICHHRNRDN